MKIYFKTFSIVLTYITFSLSYFQFFSCTKSIDLTNKDPQFTEDKSLSIFKEYIKARIAVNDYCSSFSMLEDEFKITFNSSKWTSINNAKISLLTMSDDNYLVADGNKTNLLLNKNIVMNLPLTIEKNDGKIIIEDKTVNITDTECIIFYNGKMLYFYFFPDLLALGCEIERKFNPPLPIGKKEINILFIGNSFTEDATTHLPGILKSADVTNIHMVRVFHNSYTLNGYNANYFVDNICAERVYEPGDLDWRGDNTMNKTLKEIVESREWDIVSLQEHTGKTDAYIWPGILKPAVEGLIRKINLAQPNHRPTFVYLMSQAYATTNTYVSQNYFHSQDEMFETIVNVVKQLLDDTIIDIVIPSGTMLQNLRTTSVNIDNGLDLSMDTYHMDYGISRYGGACVVYECLIGPITGKNLNGNTYRYPISDKRNGYYSTPVTDQNAPIAQAAARAAYEHPFVVTNLSSL